MKECFFLKNDKTCFDSVIQDRVFILETETGQYYWLNETASIIWQAFNKPRTLQELKKQFFNVDFQDEVNVNYIEDWLKDAVNKKILCVLEEQDSDNHTETYWDDIALDISFENYNVPQTHLLECNDIQGAASSFKTDNFETGS